MKALVADRYGALDVMRLAEIPPPRPGAGDVVVDVKAASINPVDSKVRSGAFRLLRPARFPLVAGGDVAGVVRELGSGVTRFAVGQPVFGYLSWLSRRPGAHAEQVSVPEKALRSLPPGLDFVEAAALPCAALTALVGLRACGDLRGKTVAVHGATGGVGHFALQIARARGAGRIVAVCSAPNHDLARRLGADATLDYRTIDITKVDERFDVLFDAFGRLSSHAAMRVLAPHGVYCTTSPMPAVLLHGAWRTLTGGKRIALASVHTSDAEYTALLELVAAGSLRPHVEKTFRLDEGIEAFRVLERGGVRGKVVLRVG